jgi:hypothetical protein
MQAVGLTRIERGMAAFAAILLLAVQLAIPPGFMVARGADGPALVICTGHGPIMTHAQESGLPGKAPHSKSSPACPFAGHGGAAPLAPPVFIPTTTSSAAVDGAHAIGVDLTPGRGLAAPPPPSQAPPLPLI